MKKSRFLPRKKNNIQKQTTFKKAITLCPQKLALSLKKKLLFSYDCWNIFGAIHQKLNTAKNFQFFQSLIECIRMENM